MKAAKINSSDLFAGLDDMPVRLDEEFEEERKYQEDQEKREQEYSNFSLDSPLEALKQMPVPLKIHLGLATVVCILIFFVFHYAAKPTPQESVEWWLVPWFLFGMSLTGHHYFMRREYWKGTTIILVILHVGLYILNKSYTPEFDWYFYPLLGCLMTGVALYLHQDKRGSVLKILTYEYIIVSVGSVITWINLGNLWTRFPWFVYPVFTLGLGLVLWNMWFVYNERRWYVYSGVVGADVSVQCLFTWAFLGGAYNSWPWFVIVVGISVLATLLLYVQVEGWFCCPLLENQPVAADGSATTSTGRPAVVVERTQEPANGGGGSLGGALFKAALDYMLKK